MPVPAVPSQDPGQSELNLPDIANPYLSVWWTAQTVSGVPENVMGWLVAQGWEITGVTSDNTTNPATAYYALRKDGMQPLQVLLSLCNSYTIAANEARTANEVRYNQVVANWTDMVSTSQTQFDAQTAEHNASAGVYLADLATYMDEIDTLIADNRSQIVADAQTATTALNSMNSKLSELETNANANAVIISTLLSDQAGYLSTFLNDFSLKLGELDDNYSAHLNEMTVLLSDNDAILDTFTADQQTQTDALAAAYTALVGEVDGLLTTASGYLSNVESEITDILAAMDTDYNSVDASVNSLLSTGLTAMGSFATDYEAVLALLESDYAAHVDTATAFLTDLGATDLARINEQFAASLSVQLQDLIDRGLYSSGVATDITARNTRDRDEQIQALNDRLMREKWENQHRLYGQQVDMRARTLDGKERVHSVQQSIWQYQATQIVGLHGLLQNVRERTLNATTAIYQIQDGNVRLNLDMRTRLHDVGQAVRQRLLEEAARLAQLSQSMLQWDASQRDRLLEQIQQIESQHLAGIAQQHTAQQDISRVAMSERDTLLAQLQEAVRGILTGKERYSSMLMQNASTLAEHRHRAIAEKMNSCVARLEGWNRIAAENQRLMAMQLDERNKLLIGLYSFVERREDIGPEWKDAAQLIAGLGDAAGGWIQP